MTRIWWCQEHEASGDSSNYCFEELWLVAVDKIADPCRMVPMRLIPDNDYDQMVERLADLEDRLWVMVERLDGETP